MSQLKKDKKAVSFGSYVGFLEREKRSALGKENIYLEGELFIGLPTARMLDELIDIVFIS